MTTIALYGIIMITSMTLIMHIGIILKLIPYQGVWGGRLTNDKEMVRFETVSIIVTVALICLALIQLNILEVNIPSKVMTIIWWLLSALFFLNTLGNLKSKNRLEKIIFTPLTLVLMVFCGVVALGV